MSNKDINQVVTRDQRECMEAVEQEIVEAFALCGLDVTEVDSNKFKKAMRDAQVQVDKIINGDESGYRVSKGGIEVKFIPASFVDGVVI